MTNERFDDSLIFSVKPLELLEAVRAAFMSRAVDPKAGYLLTRCGLLKNGLLTESGRALFKLACILRRDAEAQQALAQALRQLTPIQVIEQELKGLGPVPEDGVIDLLCHHKAVNPGLSAVDVRPTLGALNRSVHHPLPQVDR